MRHLNTPYVIHRAFKKWWSWKTKTHYPFLFLLEVTYQAYSTIRRHWNTLSDFRCVHTSELCELKQCQLLAADVGRCTPTLVWTHLYKILTRLVKDLASLRGFYPSGVLLRLIWCNFSRFWRAILVHALKDTTRNSITMASVAMNDRIIDWKMKYRLFTRSSCVC